MLPEVVGFACFEAGAVESWRLGFFQMSGKIQGTSHVFYFSTDHAIYSLIVVSVSARLLKLLKVSSSVTVYLSV